MSKQQRYTEEFKIEAVKQVTERQHPVLRLSMPRLRTADWT